MQYSQGLRGTANKAEITHWAWRPRKRWARCVAEQRANLGESNPIFLDYNAGLPANRDLHT